MRHVTHHLRTQPTLHERLPFTIPIDSLDVIPKPTHQASNRQQPKDKSERQSYAPLERRRFVLQVERDEDGDGADGHVG